MNSIILVNGLTHMIAALAQRDYNPGLATAALLFIPFSGWVFLSVLRLHFATVSTLVLALLWAVLAHILMVGGLVATNRYGLLSESAYHVSLVLWSLIPLAWMKVKRNR